MQVEVPARKQIYRGQCSESTKQSERCRNALALDRNGTDGSILLLDIESSTTSELSELAAVFVSHSAVIIFLSICGSYLRTKLLNKAIPSDFTTLLHRDEWLVHLESLLEKDDDDFDTVDLTENSLAVASLGLE